MNVMDYLNEGVLLEDRGRLLPWRARLDDLTHSGFPDRVIKNHEWNELQWHKPVILHGLKSISLQIILFPYGWFDTAELCLVKGYSQYSANRAFEQAYLHLSSMLGPASLLPQCRPYASQCPQIDKIARWERKPVALSLVIHRGEPFDDFLHSCFLHITRQD